MLVSLATFQDFLGYVVEIFQCFCRIKGGIGEKKREGSNAVPVLLGIAFDDVSEAKLK